MHLEEIAARIRGSLASSIPVPEDSDLLFLMYALLASSKGTSTTRRDIHDAWCVWQYTHDPSHKALVPFDQLPEETRSEDQPFLDATIKVTKEIEAEGHDLR